MKKNLSLFLVVYLLQCCALAQAQIKPQQLLGTWKSQGRTLAFTSQEELILGQGDLYCPGTWSLSGQSLKIVLAAGCGGTSIEFEVQELQGTTLKVKLLRTASSNDAPTEDEAPEEKPNEEWSYQRQKATGAAATKDDVLGFWVSRRDPERPLLIVLEDSVYFSELRGYFPWKLSQDGQWLVIQLADKPAVTMFAAAPGVLILPIEKQGNTTQLLMPNGSKADPLTNTDPVSKKSQDLKKKLIGKWFNKEREMFFEFKADGIFRVYPKGAESEARSANWKLSAGGKYLFIDGEAKTFTLEKNKLTLNGQEFTRIKGR